MAQEQDITMTGGDRYSVVHLPGLTYDIPMPDAYGGDNIHHPASAHSTTPPEPNSTTLGASDKLWGTYELTSQILHSIPIASDILLATAVCKTWRTIIETSSTIRENLQSTRHDELPTKDRYPHNLFFYLDLPRHPIHGGGYVTLLVRRLEDLEVVYAISVEGGWTRMLDGEVRGVSFSNMSGKGAKPWGVKLWDQTAPDGKGEFNRVVVMQNVAMKAYLRLFQERAEKKMKEKEGADGEEKAGGLKRVGRREEEMFRADMASGGIRAGGQKVLYVLFHLGRP